MKKILLYLPIIMLTIWSCNQMDDIYKDLDEKVEPYSNTIEYTLIAADYSKLSGYAKVDAINKLDSTWADYIVTFQSLNDSFPGNTYVPKILSGLFPAYNEGSVAKITYNYFAEMPEEYTAYSNAPVFTFGSEEYESVDLQVAGAGYFYPEFTPDVYIPEVLKNLVIGAVENDIYRVQYKYSDVNPLLSLTTTFTEGFTADLGKFDTTSIAGAQGWYKSGFGADNFAKMSGFSGSAKDNEDWLISNPIELGNDASIVLNFSHAIKYLNDQWDQLSVAISTDYDGSDIAGATWDVIDWGDVADTALLGSDYTFRSSGDIDITAYANSTIYVAFKYTSSTTNAATWEINDVTITPIKPVYAVSLGKTPVTLYDYYQYSGSAWNKIKNVHYLTSEDYDALGAPGTNDNFSTTIKPQDYLPKYLDAKYPSAGEGVSAIVVYNYYINSDLGSIVVADELIYTSGEWVSSYNFISTTTDQFINNGTEWVFDPTETIVLTNTEYKYIVDYVIANYDASFVGYDSRREFYYGVSEKYNNFDITDDKYNKEEFDFWDDAAAHALADVLLPYLYPNATLKVNGVDMYYKVVFNAYSGTTSTYSMKFQVTKAGPDPEFTLTEGPIKQ